MDGNYQKLKRLTEIYPTLPAGPERDEAKQAMRELAQHKECQTGHLDRYVELVIAEPFI